MASLVLKYTKKSALQNYHNQPTENSEGKLTWEIKLNTCGMFDLSDPETTTNPETDPLLIQIQQAYDAYFSTTIPGFDSLINFVDAVHACS